MATETSNGAHEVVISGVGTLGPAGSGTAASDASLDSGGCLPSEVARAEGFHTDEQPGHALLVPEGATREWIKPLIARRMSLPSRFAVCAARMAVHDARLGTPDQPWRADERAAVCLGNPWGSTAYSLRLLQQTEERGPESISPYLFMESVANVPAGQVALEHGIEGPNITLTQREASALAAVARGAALVASARADRVLAGVAGEMSPFLHALLGRFGALTHAGQGQPFGLDRDGFVVGEGATVFVLERESEARARGASVHARIVAWGRANDPSATASDWGTDARALAEALTKMLARFGIARDSIDRVVSGASGARRGDALEARVLRAAFQGEPPLTLAPKALCGEYGGGFLAAVLWASRAESLPTALATKLPDPELGLVSAGGIELPPARRVLVTSLASGGAATWLVLERA